MRTSKPEGRRRRRSEEAVAADLVAFQQALALVDRIDRMPAPESVKAIAEPKAQAALELIGRMKTRFERGSTTEEDSDE